MTSLSFALPLQASILVLACMMMQTTNAFSSPATTKTSTSTSTLTSTSTSTSTSTTSSLSAMKRPILDQVASTLFNLEQSRVSSSSVTDSKGRVGEPMEWSEKNSLANQFSEIIASNSVGYMFKQSIADLVAGEYDQEEIQTEIEMFVNQSKKSNNEKPNLPFSFFGNGSSSSSSSSSSEGSTQVAMFSFTSCPFCRQAKDYFDENGIKYVSMELDELEGNKGNEIRAELGRMTKRTSVPSIFINGQAIGGLNDGMPGLMPLVDSGELKKML